MNNLIFSLILVIFTLNATGQNICSLKDNVEFLHVNNVRAAISNRGTNFTNSSKASFNVPYTSSATPSSIYSTSLWFGGYDIDGNLCTNIMMYKSAADCGYIPGPFIEGFDENNYDLANNWNKIFKVTGEEILAHIADYNDHHINNAIESIYGWPGKGNSFFKEIHGFDLYESTHAGFHETMGHINGIYEPHFGEYPMVEGLSDNSIPGAIFWCVYRGGIARADSDCPSVKGLKLQIEQTVWAMSCDDDILSNTVFTRYLVSNKNDSPYHKFRFGLFVDPDIGCFDDDYVGSFPDLSSFYAYNMDNKDGPDCVKGIETYGSNPPVQAITFLGQNGLDGFSLDKTISNLETPMSFYNLLDGKFSDGTPITFGGNGSNLGSTDTVFYMFPDIPTNPDGWSMITAGIPQGDRRVLGISRLKRNPNFVFDPNESVQYDIGYTYFRKEVCDNLGNVNYAQLNIPHLHELYEDGLPECSVSECNCNCVWPGDTDKNGMVTYSDYINILKNMGSTGPARNHPVAWIGKEASDWAQNSITDVNPKYADANGDGSIDTIDLGVVDDLIGQKNLCFISEDDFCNEGDELFWNHNLNDTILSIKNIILKLTLKNETNLLGLEYDIMYDNQIFRQVLEKNLIAWQDSTIHTFYINRTNQSDKIVKHIVQFNDKKTNAKLLNLNNNILLKMILSVKHIPDTFPTNFTSIKICNAIAYYEDGTKKFLPSKALKLKMPENVVISDVENPLGNHSNLEIKVSPNPTDTELNVTINDAASGQICMELYNTSGKCVASKMSTSNSQNIDVSGLNRGIYFLRIKNDKFIKTEKIIICK